MTLEYLLGLSADEWEKLSEEQLLAWAKQFEHITRPEKIVKTSKEAKQQYTTQRNSNVLQDALKLAAQFGIKPKARP